jgi:NADH-quinone oxidoreductase subunit A
MLYLEKSGLSELFRALCPMAGEHLNFVWPLLLYGAAALVIVAGMVALSYILGQRHKEKETGEPYESGVSGTGSARLRFPVQFYLVAMLFVIFDLEAVFIIAWAVSFRDLGWPGYFGLLFFLGILLVVLVYEWRAGAFDFALRGKDILRKYRALEKSQEGR